MYEIGIFIYAAAIIASCFICRDAYQHRFLPIARPLMWMSIALFFACLFRFIHLIEPQLNQWMAQAIADFEFYLLMPLFIPLWMWMSMEYYQDRKIPPTYKFLMLFYIQPTIVIILALTDILTNGFLSQTSNTGLIDPADRIGAYLTVRHIYSAAVIIGIILGTPYLVRKRQQSPLADLLMVALTIVVPYGLFLLYRENIISIPLGIPALIFFILWGTRQYRLLDVMPVALQGVIDKVDAGILVANKHSKLLYVNNHAQRLFKLNVSQSAIEQREISIPQVFEQHFDFSSPEKQNALMATKSQDHGDETRYINAILQPVLSPKLKHHLGSTISFLDITERRQAELELENYNRQKSEFFAGISHEFRTPLTLSLGNIDDALHDLKTAKPAQLEAPLNQAKANNKRLLGLVNQLLELSRLDKGSLSIKPAKLQLSDYLPMLVANFESMAEKQNTQLHFTVDDKAQQDSTLWFDSDALDKVVLNLISNALKSITDNEGGNVYISLKTAENEQLELTVRDTGCGIPTEAQPKIFEMFYSHQMNNMAWPPGTGVGLSLVKQLLVLHGADIMVSSVEGEGTRFTVTFQRGYEHFPEDTAFITDNEAARSDLAAANFMPEDIETGLKSNDDGPAIGANGSKSNDSAIILLAEDNPDMRRYVCKHLTDFKVIEAADGEAALEMVQQSEPDLVLSDVMMPKMNGYDLCKQLKSDEKTNHIPVILLTAKSAQSEKLEGLSLGADDYLNKPFDVRELNLRINNLINARKAIQSFYQVNGLEKVISHPELPKKETVFLEKLQNYVHENIDNADIKITDLAAIVHMSERSLSRKVKAITGDTPKKMLLTIRLEQAAKLLLESADNITSLSYQVGFSDASHFARTFKAHYEMTPTEYRERG